MIRLCVALFIVPLILQLISAIDICSNKDDGNYFCYDGKKPDVCGCRDGEYCSEGRWFDPDQGDCSWSPDLATRIINCLQDPSILEFAQEEDNFCSNHRDGNYLCGTYNSPSICACDSGQKCEDGFYDSSARGCVDLSENLIARINRCLFQTAEPQETTTFNPYEPEPDPACPRDYNVKVGRSCYKVIAEATVWSDGRARCRQDDRRSHLAYIQTAEQNDELVREMLNYQGASQCFVYGAAKEIFYTSGERENLDDCDDDTFLWRVDETTTYQVSRNYENWKAGEPNCFEGRKENCLSYKCEDTDDGHTCYWNDYECSRTGCLLCQIDL